MAKRNVPLSKEYNIKIDEEIINEVYRPYLDKIHRYTIFYGGAGSGKCLGKGTRVVMYDGSLKAVENIVVGDILMGDDSSPRVVLETTSGVGNLYKVKQNKGIDYVVNDRHIISLKKSKNCKKTKTRKRRYPEWGEYTDIPIEEYIKQSNRWKRNFLGYRVGIDFPFIEVPIDPYFLGIWLGDGTSIRMEIVTQDDEIHQYIEEYANSIGQNCVKRQQRGNANSYHITGSNPHSKKFQKELMKKFKNLDLIGNKHIPDIYLHNSRDIRLKVLAGLIDTDGSLVGNCFDIIQKNKNIADGIKYLANSLGFRCSMSKCQKTCYNNGVVGTYYRLHISGNTQEIPTLLKRKQVVDYNKNVDPFSTGIKVEPYGVGEYYGFVLDGNHRFLLEDFTVTHNSFSAAQILSLQLTMMPGRNLVALRKQKTDCLDSCAPLIYKTIQELGLSDFWDIRMTDMRMTNRVNGNEIVFEGMDDPENVKSITFKNGNVTDFWYEEVTEEDSIETIEQLDLRLRDKYLKSRIFLTFNPVSRTHWLYNFVNEYIKGMDSLVLKTTYKDNAHIPDEYKEVLEAYKYKNPYKYQVYTLGEWGTMGETVFNATQVNDRLAQLANEHRENRPKHFEFFYNEDERGNPLIETFRPVETKDTFCEVYTLPEPRTPYVVSLDPAEGGNDYTAVHVRNNVTEDVVAVFHSNRPNTWCILQVLGLALWYNNALICPESNMGLYEINRLIELGYKNLYRRTTESDSRREQKVQKYGFRTTPANRKEILTTLVNWVDKNIDKIHHAGTLNEMLTFTQQEKKLKGIWWGAESGAHDDLIMSLAILLQAAEQQYCEVGAEIQELEGDWRELELEVAVSQGRLDKKVADAYNRRRKQREIKKIPKRKSKYAR